MIYNVALAWLLNDMTPDDTALIVLTTFIHTPLYPIMPRFIISVRELYDSDLRGRWQGIDTGFGVSSQPISSGNAAVSAIEFADGLPGQEQGRLAEGDVDDSEVIRLEMLGDGARLV